MVGSKGSTLMHWKTSECIWWFDFFSFLFFSYPGRCGQAYCLIVWEKKQRSLSFPLHLSFENFTLEWSHHLIQIVFAQTSMKKCYMLLLDYDYYINIFCG